MVFFSPSLLFARFYLKHNERLCARWNSLLLNYVQHDVQMSVYSSSSREKERERKKGKSDRKKRRAREKELVSRLTLIVNVEDRRLS